MADLIAKEISDGRAILKGPRIIFWIAFIGSILAVIGYIVSFFTEAFSFVATWSTTGSSWPIVGSILGLICAVIWLVLYWVELSAMANGKPYAVGLGRFLIIWMMVFSFPIGTIIGAIIWKRFSDPVVQKYLNYA